MNIHKLSSQIGMKNGTDRFIEHHTRLLINPRSLGRTCGDERHPQRKKDTLFKVYGSWGRALMSACLLFLSSCILPLFADSSEKWTGVDESVVEKYAKEHGREASEPLINTDQGDLLLFVFLAGGAIGGFGAGYSWRMLSKERQGNTPDLS